MSMINMKKCQETYLCLILITELDTGLTTELFYFYFYFYF